jgi:hypothetical protein
MSRLPAGIRARLTLGRFALAFALVALSFGVVALAERDEKSGAPTDDAVALVPARALVYVHATVDRDSDQWRNASRIANRVPALVRLRTRFLRSVTLRGGPIHLGREVYPWLGNEAALALLPGRGNVARSLILLEVSDRELANAFLSRAVGRPASTSYRGTTIDSYGSRATAFVGRFLVIGQLENVKAAIETGQGARDSLEQVAAFRKARGGLANESRLLYAYAPRAGVNGLLRAQPGLIGRLSVFLDDRRLRGVAASLDAESRGARVHFVSSLDPAPPTPLRGSELSFTPRLVNAVPQDAVAYLGMRGADRVLAATARLAGRSPLSLPPVLDRVRSELSGRSGRSLRRTLRPLLSKEAALFVARPSGVPILTLVVDGVSGSEGVRLLERLQPLLVKLLERPTAGQVPTFRPFRVAGVDAVSLRISPTVQLTFAAFGGRAVLTTATQGIGLVRSTQSPITRNPLFDAEVRDHLAGVTSVLFLDLEQLLALGEQAGLGTTRGYRQLREDLSQVSAVSGFTSSSDTSRKASIFIEVP